MLEINFISSLMQHEKHYFSGKTIIKQKKKYIYACEYRCERWLKFKFSLYQAIRQTIKVLNSNGQVPLEFATGSIIHMYSGT